MTNPCEGGEERRGGNPRDCIHVIIFNKSAVMMHVLCYPFISSGGSSKLGEGA
jgi:hypothetical protein